MPNITQLPTTSAISSATTFIVINDGTTRRFSYQDLSNKLVPNGIAGYTGSAGAGYTGSAGTGYTGSAGTGYTGSAGTGYTGSTGTVGIGVPTGGTTGQSLVKASNANYDTTWSTVTGGGGAYSRTTATAVTSSILNNTTASISITGFKSYSLLKS